MKRTFVDACVLIAAATSKVAGNERALSFLDDPGRTWITSDFIRLEVLPKALFYNRLNSVGFYEMFFQNSEEVPVSKMLTSKAIELAAKYDLHTLDGLHIAAAIIGDANEFVTLEKPSKPFFRVNEIKVISLYQDESWLSS